MDSVPSNDAQRPVELLQITLVVRDLAAIEEALANRFGLRVAFRDPGVELWGLVNAVLPMGTTFIELISPVEKDTPGGRQLARMGGDGGYMVILQTRELETWREPVKEQGVRLAWEGTSKDPESGLGWAGFHLHPGDTGGMMISLDQPDPPDSWVGAGAHWRDFVVQDVVDGLVGIELRGPDPDRLAARWAAVLGRPLGADGTIVLDKGQIGFRGCRADEIEGLSRIDLHARDRARAGECFEIGGVAFALV